MQVVVAGGAGDLGSAIVRAFLARGVETTALAHPRTDAWRLAGLPGQVIERVDLLDVTTLTQVLAGRRDLVVVNAAARSGHPRTPGGPSRADLWRDTVLTTVSLLDALDDADVVSVVHLGSSLQYRPTDAPLTEAGPFAPITGRGVAKQAASDALWHWAAETGVATAELMVFRAFGPAEGAGRLLPVLIDAAHSGATVPLVDVETRRDMVYVDDVAESVLRVVDSAAYGERLNVGTGIGSTVPDIVAAFEAASGHRIRVARGARPAHDHDVRHWRADPTRCRQRLGWQPQISLAEGMERLWAVAGR